MPREIEYVILGGGLAGLSAAKRLLEIGIQPMLIEAGNYPSHKICGEFISPSGVKILKKWDIHPVLIHEADIYNRQQHLRFPFPKPAGALSHFTLDTILAQQIEQQGALVLTKTKVNHLVPSFESQTPHLLHLDSEEIIAAKHLVIATGKIPGFSQSLQPAYVGFKAHFTGLDLKSTLQMFTFPNSYLGILPVENQWFNLAGLVKIKQFKRYASVSNLMNHLRSINPHLNHLLCSAQLVFNDWMQSYVPAFGFRKPPYWPRTYWIGDAISTIPPASGNGLSLALASGYLAAEFAFRDDAENFRKIWKSRCFHQILWAKGLHQIFLHPFLCQPALSINTYFPLLGQKIFHLTRDPGL